MKKFRRMMALLLATVMVLAMAIPGMAATVTMTTLEGHTYEIFQVFTGTVDADGKTLTELKYGSAAKTGTTGQYLSKTDLAALKAIEKRGLTDEQEIIDAYLPYVDFTKTPVQVVTGTASTELVPGYYVIRDKGDTVPTGKPNDTTTLYMFQVLNSDFSTSAKAGTVESKKKVQDINDSTDTAYGELQDSADHEIGDRIPYTLTFKLPDNYDKFEEYFVEFSDDMCDGLTLIENSVKIQYGTGQKQSIAFTNAGDGDLGTLYTYTINDLKKTAPDMKKGETITITYDAYLNDKAVIGKTGNPNEYTVEFNNNPNNSGAGKPTGKTPKDKNIVFTYQANFDKIDENKKPLEGADFKLEKQMEDGSWADVTSLGGNGRKHPEKIGSSAEKSTTFSFKGLDDGVYRLTETYTPDGYNTIDPITFTISASHEAESDDPKLTKLESDGLTMTADLAKGTLTTSIENKSGAVLPSTGGMGTTIFYVVGAILVLGASVLLVSKRRVDAQ